MKSKGIGRVSTAYRNCSPGKCNIDFAKEVFEYIAKCESAYIFVVILVNFLIILIIDI